MLSMILNVWAPESCSNLVSPHMWSRRSPEQAPILVGAAVTLPLNDGSAII